MSGFQQKTMKRKNKLGLALQPAAPPPPAPPGQSTRNSTAVDTLEIGVEFRLDLKSEDLIVIKELGAGNGGTVSKVQHAATKVIMARKIIHVDAQKEVRKRIVRELQIMHECSSPYIVSFFGAFMNETGDVIMCMEYMDVGSLDAISKNFGPVRVDVLGKIAEAVLGGLTYLYSAHKIMHRDIKPSNVLVNSRGQIKLCDFGVSNQLTDSVAQTFVGTGTYMAPERISGSPYTVKSDVWSVGLTVMELAIGKFPFASDNGDDDDDEDSGGPQGILDLLQQIVMEPSPKLPQSDAFPAIMDDMISKCLVKDPQGRPTPQELFDHDAFIQAAKRTPVDLAAWATSLMMDPSASHEPQVTSPSAATIHAPPLPLATPTAGSAALQTPTTSSEMDLYMQNLSLEGNSRQQYPSAPANSYPYQQQQQHQPQQARYQQPPTSNPPQDYSRGPAPPASNQYYSQTPTMANYQAHQMGYANAPAPSPMAPPSSASSSAPRPYPTRTSSTGPGQGYAPTQGPGNPNGAYGGGNPGYGQNGVPSGRPTPPPQGALPNIPSRRLGI